MRTALLLSVVSFSALASSKPLSWVVFQNEGQHQLTYSDGTSDQDVRRAKAARAGRSGSFFWFHSADGDFAITDPATVNEIVGALEPVNLIGRKMEALGEKEGELGEKQGALGEKLAERADHRARRATKAAAATERRGAPLKTKATRATTASRT